MDNKILISKYSVNNLNKILKLISTNNLHNFQHFICKDQHKIKINYYESKNIFQIFQIS